MARLSYKTTRTQATRHFVTGGRKNMPSMPIIRIIGCPDCKATLGAHCTKPDGSQTSAHASRKRMAARTLNSQRSDFTEGA